MSEPEIQKSFALLIELLYGLAITEGLAKAVPSLLDKDGFCFWDLLFTAAALFIGLGDWLVYHLLIASSNYRSLGRLILDMFFPMLIFIMFAAVGQPDIDTAAVIGYFILAWGYFLALRKEREVPRWILQFLRLCTMIIVNGVAVYLSSTLCFSKLPRAAAITAAAVWIFAVMKLASIELAASLVKNSGEADKRQASRESEQCLSARKSVSLGLGTLAIGAIVLIAMRRPTQGLKRTPGGAA